VISCIYMTVSVIIPNYNHAEYLKQRIESILNQTYTDFELIILDDCSTDKSLEIIEDYTKRFPSIRSYRNEINCGTPFSQWDHGVELAGGEFIWIAESDDFAEPQFLQKATEIMISHKNIGLGYCDSRIIDEKKKSEYLASDEKSYLNSIKWHNNYINNGRDELSEYLSKNNIINNVSGVLFRKNKYIEAGKADKKMRFCGDWFMYIRILLISDVAYIAEPLNSYRIHANSTIYEYFSSNTYIKEVIRVYLFLLKNIRLSPKKYFLMLKFLTAIVLKRIRNIITGI
jgi:glycosyltransferase involved in cell wall biosynthesis